MFALLRKTREIEWQDNRLPEEMAPDERDMANHLIAPHPVPAVLPAALRGLFGTNSSSIIRAGQTAKQTITR